MTELEQVSDLYRRLPPDARREALDFMLFLKQRYDDRVPAPGRRLTRRQFSNGSALSAVSTPSLTSRKTTRRC